MTYVALDSYVWYKYCSLCINKLVKHKLTHGAVGGGLETCDTPMICCSNTSSYLDLGGDGPTEIDSKLAK